MAENVTMTEDEFEARLNDTHYSGVAGGWGNAANMVLNQAKDAFANGRDEEACRLRELAEQMKAQSRIAHTKRAVSDE